MMPMPPTTSEIPVIAPIRSLKTSIPCRAWSTSRSFD